MATVLKQLLQQLTKRGVQGWKETQTQTQNHWEKEEMEKKVQKTILKIVNSEPKRNLN